MLTRNNDDKLKLKTLDLEIFFGDLFAECKTLQEIDWLREQLIGALEITVIERMEEIK